MANENPQGIIHDRDIIKEMDQLTDSKQDKKEFSTSIYSMRLTTDYSSLKEKLNLAFDEYL